MMCKNNLWWAVRRLLKSLEHIVHVAHPYSIASITSTLNSLILSDSRAFRRSYDWEVHFLTLAQAAPMRRLISVSRSALSLIAPLRYTNSVVCYTVALMPQFAARSTLYWDLTTGARTRYFLRHCQSESLTCDNFNVHHPGKPTRRCRHHSRIVCIQHPLHRSPDHFQCSLLPRSAILTLRPIIEIHQVRNDQRALCEPL